MTYKKYLESLNKAENINTFAKEKKLKVSSKGNLFILNYDEIVCKSEKDWFTHYSKALVLTGEPKNYKPVAKSFNRFYNLQENPTYLKDIDDIDFTKDFTVEYKHDGSLILLYWFNGMWNVNTRGSFADGNVSSLTNKISNITWEKLFFDTFVEKYGEFFLQHLDKKLTYSFELCSPYNQVVECYERPSVHFLSAFNPETGKEYYDLKTDLERPKRYKASSKEDIFTLLKTLPTTSEGFVITQKNKDGKIKRKKCKTETWAKLAHNAVSYNNRKSLWQVFFKGDNDEIVAIFPHLKEPLEKNKKTYEKLFVNIKKVFAKIKKIENQKEFAIEVQKNYKEFAGVLFLARQKGEVKPEFVKELILKNYKKFS